MAKFERLFLFDWPRPGILKSIQQVFTPDFMPQGYCYLWNPRMVWLHVIADGLIALSYYCVPIILVYFIRKNRDLLMNRVCWMFASFVLACGTTHLMEIWNVWHESYLVTGVIKGVTAIVSLLSAVMLIPLVPSLISLPGRIQMKEVNRKLEEEIAKRTRDLEEREHLKAVVESSDDAIISKTLSGTINAWNPSAEKLFGYSSAEAVGKSIEMLLPPDRLKEESGILARIARGERVDHFETERMRKDGKKIDVSVTISPIKDGSGVIVGASKIARDISERKRAEQVLAGQALELLRYAEELSFSQQALQSQTLMLQSVLDSMSEGLVVANEREEFVIWNPAAERIIGLGTADVPSTGWSAHYGLFMPDTVTPFPPAENPLLRAIHGEVCSAEMFLRNPKLAEGVWIEASASPLRDKDGVLRGGVTAFRDVTQRKRDEREIQKLNDELENRVTERTAQLEAANKELEAFSYSVSHDLRAPLRHISGFSKLLTEEYGSTIAPGAQHYLDRIQAGTQTMGLLVDELLNLARVGRCALNRQTTKLNTIVTEVITLLESESEGRQVEWVIADLPMVDCDPILVKQVFQNLLANALKFTRTREHAIIEVRHTDGEDGQPVFTVRDNGIGFDMKYVDKLFGVFQRLHRAEDFEGTGVGLATVQRIVQKHGGRVWTEGDVNKGAVFYFTLSNGKPAEAKRNRAVAGGRS